MPVSSYGDLTTSLGVSSPAVILLEMLPFAPVEGSAILWSATAVVCLPLFHQQERLLGQGHLSLGGHCCIFTHEFSHLSPFTQIFTPHVVVDVFRKHRGSSCDQYESGWTAFPHSLMLHSVTFFYQGNFPGPVSSLS